MGILSYYRTLLKTHPDIVIKDISSIEIQHLYLDFNGFIHGSLHKLRENDKEINEKNILKQCCDDVKEIVNLINPKQSLYIAIDGVAPKAKMMQQRYRRYKSSLENKEWDTNAITPGTKFMKKLSKKLQLLSKKFTINVIINDADNPGEGEHKILQYMKTNSINESSCIHGLDSDLIMLLLTLEQQNLYIYREKQDEIETHLVSIDTFRNELKQTNVKDYIFICFMAGNDFLPHIPSIDIKFGGIDKMIDIYSEPLLNENNEIDKTNFIKFLEKLVQREDVMVTEISKRLHSQLLIDDNIKMGSKGWKRRYYQECFGTSEQNDIKTICFKYWQGLQWTIQYYFDKCHDWSWYYPYRHAPCVSDILDVIKYTGFFEFQNIKPYSPIQQLLIVLPPSSKYLLPKEYQYIYNDIKYAHLFPLEFQLDKLHKTQEWQCYPILPEIEEDFFKEL